MKLRTLTAATALATIFTASTMAQAPQISQTCLQNISDFTQYCKQASKSGNYADAVNPWTAAYKECPSAHQSIYVYGPRIVIWQINQTPDIAKKTTLFNTLMEVYDNRMKYFTTSSKPSYYIRGRKAFDYINYSPLTNVKNTDPLKKQAYGWLKQCIEEGGVENEIQVFQYCYMLSRDQYEADSKNKAIRQQYVDDYLMLTEKLAERAADGAAEDSVYDQLKGGIDMDFGRSGAADCATLNAIYSGDIDSHKADKDYLTKVLKLYTQADCDGSATYFKASEYLYKLSPTYTAACGLAAQAFNKKDINGAITYLNQAATLTTSKADKSNIMLKISQLYSKQGNYQNARSYAQKAIAFNSSNGTAYIIIATLYASHCTAISSDPFVQKTAFWAAVDKCEKAKAVDPTCTAMANKLISSYKPHFPDKKECFMRKISGSYKVPGWIGETTTVR